MFAIVSNASFVPPDFNVNKVLALSGSILYMYANEFYAYWAWLFVRNSVLYKPDIVKSAGPNSTPASLAFITASCKNSIPCNTYPFLDLI
jgi:hypothetical protein